MDVDTRSWTSFDPQTRQYTKQPVSRSISQPPLEQARALQPIVCRRCGFAAGLAPSSGLPNHTPLPVSFHLLRQIGKRRGLEAYDEAGDLSRAQTNDSCPCPHNRRKQSQHTNTMRIDKMRFRCRVNINAQPSTRDDIDKPRCLELGLVLPACGA